MVWLNLLFLFWQSGIRKLEPKDAEQVGDPVMEAILLMLNVSKAGGVQEDALMALGCLVEGLLLFTINDEFGQIFSLLLWIDL